MLALVLAMSLCVCMFARLHACVYMSHASITSKGLNGSSLIFGTEASLGLCYTVLRNSVISKNKGTSLWDFSTYSGLQNFATACSPSPDCHEQATIVNLLFTTPEWMDDSECSHMLSTDRPTTTIACWSHSASSFVFECGGWLGVMEIVARVRRCQLRLVFFCRQIKLIASLNTR